MNPEIILDFDSTIVQCETLDLLAEIALSQNPRRDEIVGRVKEITDRGMAGSLAIEDSLKLRLNLLTAHRDHIQTLNTKLSQKISPSFLKNKNFLSKNAHRISIISAGFTECITPIANQLGLLPNRIHANILKFSPTGFIEGIDQNAPLSKTKGKVLALTSLHLERPVHAIGDGYTDYEIFKEGYADAFYAYTETASRPSVTTQPNIHVIRSFDEYLTITSQYYEY